MRPWKAIWLLILLAFVITRPAWAQVERVLADASGVTWASCAAVMEIALRRLDGVDKIAISISRQTFEVSYKPGSSFQPWDLRDAVAKAEVEVVRFYIAARGQVKVENSKRFFLAGKDKFLLADSPKVPTGVPLSIVGAVDDSAEPLQLKIRDFKPLQPWNACALRQEAVMFPCQDLGQAWRKA